MKTLTKEQRQFSKELVLKLGEFVKEQKHKAKKQGIDIKEFQAIVSTVFSLLGKNAEYFRKRAKIK